MARFDLDIAEFSRLEQALKGYSGNAEEIINSVLHNEGSQLIQDEIKLLMPVSGRDWSGKKPSAKSAKSLTDEKGNLSVTVKTTKNYHYLYFPDDGTTTRNHAGNRQFFLHGGENKQTEIIDLCIERLGDGFEKS